MTWDTFKAHLETLESASANGQHDQVLVELTAACIELAQIYVRFLDLRAKTRAIRGQFDTALDDTATMQQLAPTSALGYLREGYIHDMRGLRREAIRVYDQGLNHVSTEDPAYQRVVKAKSSSEEALHYRYDFMSHLPLDILANIAPRIVGRATLSSDKVYPYLNVSKTWHHIISSMASLHFVMRQPQTLDQGHDQLVSVSKHVKGLTLRKCPKSINRLFNRASFDALTQLTIQGCTIANDDSFLLMLRALGKNLTHLTISKLVLQDKSSIDLGWILLDCNCPNLESLVIFGVNMIISSLNHLYPKLKRFSIMSIGQQLGREDIQQLLSCFPSLEGVALDSPLDPCLLTMIQEKCPSLYQLWFGLLQVSSFGYSASGDSEGICDAMLELDRRSGAKYAETVEFLVKHCQTLRGCRLYLGSIERIHDENMVTLPSDVQFSELDTLHIVSWEQEDFQQSDGRLFEWIIQHSPDLRTIYVSGTTAIQLQVIQSICKHTSLENVMFNAWDEDQHALILQFLQYHHSLGTESTLHGLSISFTPITAPLQSLFSKMAQLSQLQTLWIEMYTSLTGVNMPNFVKALASNCPHLHNLTLIFPDGIPKGVSSHFHLIPSLKTLTLFPRKLSYEDALALTNCRKLKRLALYGISPTPDVAKLLRDRIPSFTYDNSRRIPSAGLM